MDLEPVVQDEPSASEDVHMNGVAAAHVASNPAQSVHSPAHANTGLAPSRLQGEVGPFWVPIQEFSC
jgi:hypothetical protein